MRDLRMLQARESFARDVDASLRFPVVLYPREGN